MSAFMSKRLAELSEYIPGEQPRDMRYIKLNTNESPYPPAPGAAERVCRAVASLMLYPDPEQLELRDRIARAYSTGTDNVFVANGSDEVLSFSYMAFCDGERGMAYPQISYGFYPVYARLYGIEGVEIPLREDFTINPDDYMSRRENIVIANPNAPTGIALSVGDIEKIVASNPQSVVIIDEAYIDFGAQSCVSLTHKYSNLLVCMTSSKSRSLAGGRLGWAIGDGGLISDLNKIKFSTNPYNINRLTQAAGCAAFDDDEYFRSCTKKIIQTREYTLREMRKLGFFATDSLANFIFVSHSSLGGAEYYGELKKRGVLVRYFAQTKLENFVRISIGTEEQMQILLEKTKEILYNKGIR